MLDRKLTATGAAQKPFANRKPCAGMPSPGGEETGEGELNSNLPYRSTKPGARFRERSEPAHLRRASSFDDPFICENLCSSVAKIVFVIISEIRVKLPTPRCLGRVPSVAKKSHSTQFNQFQPDWTKLNLN